MTKISRSFLQSIANLACDIQQIPSPTFEEGQKADFLIKAFQEEGLHDVQRDLAGNVYACFPGGPGRPLVVSAHMDTVHPHETRLDLQRDRDRITGPAIGDNSLGVASLFGLARLLKEQGSQLPGDIWLVANVCEEGLGDLRGMRAVVDHFGSRPLAYLIVEGMGLGEIYHRGLGVERYRISAHTEGGHSWVDFGKPSAIHHLAELIVAITNLPLPSNPRTSLNVGIVHGGTSINTIASQASFELDLRSEDTSTLRALGHQVRQMVEASNQAGVRFSIEPIGLRPAGEIPVHHPLVQLAVKSLKHEGIEPYLEIASTDANIPLSQGLPAVCLGMTSGAGAHTSGEYIDIPPLAQGLKQLLSIVNQAWLLPES